MKSKISKALNVIKRRVFKPVIRRLGGWNELQEQIDSLNYIIKNYLPINDFPKATGSLRKTQLADTELLRLFHEICEKHGLIYWLDYGTLLGAYRHKGFIPWDDDLDIAMPRNDYNKLSDILAGELETHGFEIWNYKSELICINLWNAGVKLDVFPVDCISEDDAKRDLRCLIGEYRNWYSHNKNHSEEALDKKKINLFGNSLNNDDYLYFHGPEFAYGDFTTFKNQVVFPLKKQTFEEYEFFVPNDMDAYLEEEYGTNYKDYPRFGMLHHDVDNEKLYNNSIKFNFDLDSFITKLKNIHL